MKTPYERRWKRVLGTARCRPASVLAVCLAVAPGAAPGEDAPTPAETNLAANGSFEQLHPGAPWMPEHWNLRPWAREDRAGKWSPS